MLVETPRAEGIPGVELGDHAQVDEPVGLQGFVEIARGVRRGAAADFGDARPLGLAPRGHFLVRPAQRQGGGPPRPRAPPPPPPRAAGGGRPAGGPPPPPPPQAAWPSTPAACPTPARRRSSPAVPGRRRYPPEAPAGPCGKSRRPARCVRGRAAP